MFVKCNMGSKSSCLCNGSAMIHQSNYNVDKIQDNNEFDVNNIRNDPYTMEEIELRAQLNNGIVVQYIRAYSRSVGYLYLMEIWDKIEEYQLSTSASIATSTMNALCEKLLSNTATLVMGRALYHMCIEESDEMNYRDKEILINAIQRRCLQLISSQIFKPFTETREYKEMQAYFNSPDCWVTAECFDYLDVIATGAFGLVFHCRKISTNQHYAMKVQPKSSLLRLFRFDKNRVTNELAANILFSHPYISGIVYAFQTETLTMLVSRISACGDLRRSLSICRDHRMCLDRVVFYSSEILSALMYLHRHDVIYRDLKPSNILLNADGHVMLADFGSLAGKLYECNRGALLIG